MIVFIKNVRGGMAILELKLENRLHYILLELRFLN